MGVQWGKIAMVLSGLAFELHILTMSSPKGNYQLSGYGGSYQSEDDAVHAFLIIAYLAFAVALVLLLLVNFSSLKGKLFNIIALISLFVAAFSVVVAVSVYGGTLDKIPNSVSINPYSVTTYVIAAASGILGGVFLLMEMCCGGK